MLRVHDIRKAYGGHQALDGISFEIGAKDKVALVGVNGAGKSTLLKIIAGSLPADSGFVKTQPGTEVSYLPQDAGIASDRTLWDEMLAAFPELTETQAELASVEAEMATAYEDMDRLDQLVQRQGELLDRFDQLGGYRVEAEVAKVLAGLGFESGDRDKLCAHFSGGWQMRIALAKMLVRKPGLLLLDEPTNHLDLRATEWLEDYLAEYPGMVVVVSHDRYFLDRVVTRAIEVEDGKGIDYRGNYSYFLAEKERKRKEAIAAYERQQKWIKRQQDFINRFRANAARAAVVRSRQRALEKLVRLEQPRAADPRITVRFAAGKPGPEQVVEVQGLAKGFAGRTLIASLALRGNSGERVALVGPTGAGKSTLLKLLAGVETPDGGTIKFGQNVTVGYFAQDQAQTLDESRTVLEEMLAHAPSGWGEENIRATLAKFLFKQDDVHKKIAGLSGGEKSRLSLAKLLLQPRQLLLLDEPTNHLDVPSKDELEKALDNYPGAVVFSSHDRFLLDRVATTVAELKDGKLEVYLGGWSRFREVQAEREEAAEIAAADAATPVASAAEEKAAESAA
ncbi:MAG: ATP-binding cassette domain-containing protein [Chloroflexota bacterium]|nr:ATP-binding cassette domain-containing protein [Chloroflexota bacterium]